MRCPRRSDLRRDDVDVRGRAPRRGPTAQRGAIDVVVAVAGDDVQLDSDVRPRLKSISATGGAISNDAGQFARAIERAPHDVRAERIAREPDRSHLVAAARNHASAASKSSTSPTPSSNAPVLAPTPRKLNFNVAKRLRRATPLDRVDDGVVHVAAVLRMRMARARSRRVSVRRVRSKIASSSPDGSESSSMRRHLSHRA